MKNSTHTHVTKAIIDKCIARGMRLFGGQLARRAYPMDARNWES